MGIKGKIAIMVGIPMAALVALLILGEYNIMRIETGTNEIVQQNFGNLLSQQITPLIDQQMLPLINKKMLPLIEKDIAELQRMQHSIQLLLEADRDVHQTVVAEKRSLASTTDEMEGIKKTHQENIDQALKRITDATAGFEDEEMQKLITEWKAAFELWQTKTHSVLEKVNTPGKLRFALKASNGGSAEKSFNAMRDLIDKMQGVLQGRIDAKKELIAKQQAGLLDDRDLILRKKTAIDQSREEVFAKAEKLDKLCQESLVLFPVFSGIAIVIALIVAVVTALRISRPIEKAMGLAVTIQDGDLSQRLHLQSKDEIGRMANALDTMADRLEEKAQLARTIAEGDLSCEVPISSDRDVLGQALQTMTRGLGNLIQQSNQAARQMLTGSSQVSDASQTLSQGATEQASSLEEIGASMNQMGSQTDHNADNASQANTLAAAARDAAEKGNGQMEHMVTAMGEIQESSQEISRIIKVIDDIAFQTNLLALNAAVEAARAGRHGKGFAVVAEEVRNLAARSAKAAKETGALIEQSSGRVKRGTDIANGTFSALQEIVESVAKVTDLVGEIAAASKEQAQGISQVNQGLGQIDSVTQQNSANAEETAAASQELSSQAQALLDLLSTFRLREEASAPPAAAPVPPAAPAEAAPPPPTSTPQLGWGNQPGGEPEEITAKDIISLDDDDFGKY